MRSIHIQYKHCYENLLKLFFKLCTLFFLANAINFSECIMHSMHDICNKNAYTVLYALQKGAITISNSICCGFLRKDQCNIACLQTEMHWQLAVVTLRGGDELCRVISAVQVCRFAIMFLDTLCSKKWYSTIQWSTIPRIGRHSAGYN